MASIEVSIGCARGSLTNTLTVRWVKNGRQASFMSRERTWGERQKEATASKKDAWCQSYDYDSLYKYLPRGEYQRIPGTVISTEIATL